MPTRRTSIFVPRLSGHTPGTLTGSLSATTVRLSGFLLIAVAALLLILPTTQFAFAGEADVIDARITALGDGQYRIDATVKHADTGWDHYADRWDVLTEDGTVLGARELAHPHENEQPFTRSLTLAIPSGIKKIILRANDSVHELGGQEFEIMVP